MPPVLQVLPVLLEQLVHKDLSVLRVLEEPQDSRGHKVRKEVRALLDPQGLRRVLLV